MLLPGQLLCTPPSETKIRSGNRITCPTWLGRALADANRWCNLLQGEGGEGSAFMCGGARRGGEGGQRPESCRARPPPPRGREAWPCLPLQRGSLPPRLQPVQGAAASTRTGKKKRGLHDCRLNLAAAQSGAAFMWKQLPGPEALCDQPLPPSPPLPCRSDVPSLLGLLDPPE